ncbi:MAG: hypothetical protein IPH88_10925 [Bacteroidales bacterium]|nr:hypothetical protein [Bacteroidales bacterium]
MLIIVDKRLPSDVKNKLSSYGEVVEFFTEGITYEAISGHPDIFFCKTDEGLIAAPNAPDQYLDILNKKGVHIIKGEKEVGSKYPETARYNAVVNSDYLICNMGAVDSVVKETGRRKADSSEEKILLNVNQGYTRCNLIDLGNNSYITSDKGIFNILVSNGLNVLFLEPAGILLPGFENGFIGGCAGVWGNTLFLAGNLNKYPEGEKIREFLAWQSMEVIELYQGPLIDGGSILFLD